MGATPTVTCDDGAPLPPQTLDLQAAIDEAIASKSTSLLLTRGEYRVEKTLSITGAHGLVIDGQGSRLVFTNATANPDSSGIVASGNVDLTLRRLAIDYDPLPFTQGRVVATAQGTTGASFDVQVDDGYRSDLPFFVDNVTAQELSLRPYDPASRRLKIDGLRMAVSKVESPSAGVLRFSTTDAPVAASNVQVGDLVATANWRSAALRLLDGGGTVLDDVTVHAANGASIEEVGGDGGTDARVCLTPGPAPPGASAARLHAGNRDGFNSRLARKGPTIHDSLIEKLGDDGIATNGPILTIPKLSGKTIVLSAPSPELPTAAPPGTPVEVYASDTLEVRISTRVAAVTTTTVTLEDATGVKENDGFILLSRADEGTTVRNSIIRDVDASGVNVSSRGALLEGNTIERTYLSGILLAYQLSFYAYGPAPLGTTVRGNVLRDVAIGRQAQGGFAGISLYADGKDWSKLGDSRAIGDITIESTTIEGSSGWGILITHAERVSLTGVRLTRTNEIARITSGTLFGPSPSAAVFIDSAADVTFRCSTVSEQGPYGDGGVELGPRADRATIDTTGLIRQ